MWCKILKKPSVLVWVYRCVQGDQDRSGVWAGHKAAERDNGWTWCWEEKKEQKDPITHKARHTVDNLGWAGNWRQLAFVTLICLFLIGLSDFSLCTCGWEEEEQIWKPPSVHGCYQRAFWGKAHHYLNKSCLSNASFSAKGTCKLQHEKWCVLFLRKKKWACVHWSLSSQGESRCFLHFPFWFRNWLSVKAHAATINNSVNALGTNLLSAAPAEGLRLWDDESQALVTGSKDSLQLCPVLQTTIANTVFFLYVSPLPPPQTPKSTVSF